VKRVLVKNRIEEYDYEDPKLEDVLLNIEKIKSANIVGVFSKEVELQNRNCFYTTIFILVDEHEKDKVGEVFDV